MFETVYTMTDWYDGPRRGVASVNGKSHLYESCWNNIGSDDNDVFLLSEISEQTLRLAVEDWEIWERWSAAFKRGETPHETHPCLPEDRTRHEELELLLKSALVVDESRAFAAVADFLYNEFEPRMQASWSVVSFSRVKNGRSFIL